MIMSVNRLPSILDSLYCNVSLFDHFMNVAKVGKEELISFLVSYGLFLEKIVFYGRN